jgi:hypothetical protein
MAIRVERTDDALGGELALPEGADRDVPREVTAQPPCPGVPGEDDRPRTKSGVQRVDVTSPADDDKGRLICPPQPSAELREVTRRPRPHVLRSPGVTWAAPQRPGADQDRVGARTKKTHHEPVGGGAATDCRP